MLIVEVDGGQHCEKKDRARTRYLTGQGFRIVRYWNNDVLQNTDGVLQSLGEMLGEV
jgi:ATP-dependent helicase HrpA/adenine-specific DNA-methyltransferase